jgi:hypothetical protein
MIKTEGSKGRPQNYSQKTFSMYDQQRQQAKMAASKEPLQTQ